MFGELGLHYQLAPQQRTVCLDTTGTMSTTLGAALDALLQSTATKAAHRLVCLDLHGNICLVGDMTLSSKIEKTETNLKNALRNILRSSTLMVQE